MTSEFLALPRDENVAFAIDALRNLEEDFETVRYVYLIDEDEHLAGAVTLNNLLVNDGSTKLSDIASVDLITAGPEDDQEDVAESISKYNLLALPIVSDEQRLLGIVTVDDALDVMRSLARSTLARSSSVLASTDGRTSPILSFTTRVPRS